MKCYSLLLILLIGQAFAQSKVEIGFVNLPPHIERDEKSGKITGTAVDYIRQYIEKPTGLHFDFQPIPFMRGYKLLQNEKLDAYLTVIKTKERLKDVHYGARRFFKIIPGICFLKGHLPPSLDLYKGKNLSGKRIGHINGTVLPKALQKSGAYFTPLNGINYLERGLSMLRLKRLDGLFHPVPLSMKVLAKRLGMGDSIKCLSYEKDGQEIFIGWRKKIPTSVMKKFNRVIAHPKMTYDEYMNQYIIKNKLSR